MLVSHCDFSGNSAYHVFSIAMELDRLGLSSAIAVPRNPRGVRDFGRPSFPVLSFASVRRGRLLFPDGGGPDIVHAFTPRPHVRDLTLEIVRQTGCRYVVHLEDNELEVQDAVAGSYDATASGSFIEGASGMSVIVDRLLELKPAGMPGVVIWPGYDEAIDRVGRPRDVIRRDIGLSEDDLAIVYTGNVHEANFGEVRNLYEAVRLLRDETERVVLIRSGWNHVRASRLPKLDEAILDLGWIRRRRVPELLRSADIFVQPGSPGPFNDYRFPSKLPDFLASGHPVVLPRTNIGLHLEDGVEALLLERGDANEIAEKVGALINDVALRRSVGRSGRAFAVRELVWSTNITDVARMYEAL